MARLYQECVLSLLIVTLVFLLYLLMQKAQELKALSSFEDSWLMRLNINILGYCCILVPGYFAHKYVQASGYLERPVMGWFGKLIHMCLGDRDVNLMKSIDTTSAPTIPITRSAGRKALQLFVCFIGLQGSYLVWGILQEKIMTQEYRSPNGGGEHFKDSQFLVFVNRILAFTLSGLYLMFSRQPKHDCPLYKYVYCSMSNILSSWCQYEALKFVTFPTQVLVKASKIIPVMIMGKVVSKKKFEYYEYVTAVLMSLGMVVFLLDNGNEHKGVSETTFSGVVLMIMYMSMDSFTSNWQSKLFSTYHMSSVQMMCGVNLFSCLFTAVSLLSQGGFLSSLEFVTKYPQFAVDCVLLSICSAAGQLFIFYTIATFGPVVFVIITTLRQVFAILLSCLIYQHNLSFLGFLGVIVVFIAIFLRIYCNQRLRNIRKEQLRSGTQG